MSIQILKSNQIPMSILMSSLRTTAMKRCVISDETRAAGAVDRDLHRMRRILKRWRLSRFAARNQTRPPPCIITTVITRSMTNPSMATPSTTNPLHDHPPPRLSRWCLDA